MFTSFKVLFTAVMLLSVPPVFAQDIRGRVVSVGDGDTITVLAPDKQQVKVRMDSIDAPEKGQPYGQNAQKALADKVAGKEVLVRSKEKDRYGRTIGVVMLGERNINREIVSEGHAWAYRQYLSDKQLISFEEQAKAGKLGLWRLPPNERQPPWEWRKARKSEASERRKPSPGDPSSKCGAKRSCKAMSSCAEAKHYLNVCGLKIDGDGDGVPCEALCR